MFNVVILADHKIGYDLTRFLLEEQEAGNVNIICVFTNEKKGWWPSISQLQSEFRFHLKVYKREEELVEIVQEQKIDFVFLFSWNHILKAIGQSEAKYINLHYSLLPLHRGLYPVNWAIQSGDRRTGITFHWVTNGIDSGDIIGQLEVEINSWDDSKALIDRMDTEALSLFKDLWEKREKWALLCQPQAGAEISYHSMHEFVKSNELDLNKTYRGVELINLIRAKNFGPDVSHLYYIDESTGKRVYIYLNLVPE